MKSRCRACGLTFSTLHNFERHRIGKYDITAPGYGRRCRTPDEMLAADWRKTARGWTPEAPWKPQHQRKVERSAEPPMQGRG